MEQPTLAQIAYDAYCTMLRLFLDGTPSPPAWEDLPAAEHAAWTYAVQHVEAYLADLYARRTHT